MQAGYDYDDDPGQARSHGLRRSRTSSRTPPTAPHWPSGWAAGLRAARGSWSRTTGPDSRKPTPPSGGAPAAGPPGSVWTSRAGSRNPPVGRSPSAVRPRAAGRWPSAWARSPAPRTEPAAIGAPAAARPRTPTPARRPRPPSGTTAN